MRVINVLHRVGGNLKESKDYSRQRLMEMGKIRKMEEGGIHKQHVIVRQILTWYNLEHAITFGLHDFSKIQMPHKDPLVVTLKVANCIVKRVL